MKITFSMLLNKYVALLLMSVPIAYAEDVDFDYLPPDKPSLIEGITEFIADIFSTPKHPGSYTSAKKLLYRKVKDQTTLYCTCTTDLPNRTFDKLSCNYVPQDDNVRAHRLEAEHVVPAFWIAAFNPNESCWQAHDSCGSGRECCLKNSDRFKTAHNDLVNLMPSIGELNGDRSNYIFDIIDNESREYGACDFEVDSANKITEPKDDIRGDIARIYHYMRDTYDLVYPDKMADQLADWDLSDPISQAERDRNQRIQDTQGSSNPLIN